MSTHKNKLWIEKYRPKTLDDYLFHDNQLKKSVARWIEEDKIIPNLLLSGVQGTGKTTLAKILISALGVQAYDVLVINASDENNVDTIREKIISFATTLPIGEFKVFLLEEADYISQAGQGILRNLMEQASNTARFILTCNYNNKIIPPIRSRCQHYDFRPTDREEVMALATRILAREKVKFNFDDLENYVAIGYPDIRKIINLLQQNVHEGLLTGLEETRQDGDYKFKLLPLIEKDDWFAARKLLCANVANEEWGEVYRFLYENIDKCPKFLPDSEKWEEAIIIIAEHLYQDSLVSDREINAASMLIQLARL